MARREVVQYDGQAGGHRNPIPTCVTLGDLILPSVIGGQGADDPRKAIEQAFTNMQRIIDGAGGTLDGIGKINIYLKNFQHREIVNEFWVKMFPDENDRPARHVMAADLADNTVIQMDVIASK
jgi:enamine deaminase RidA (YjgF/YER057c/UK114 family)